MPDNRERMQRSLVTWLIPGFGHISHWTAAKLCVPHLGRWSIVGKRRRPRDRKSDPPRSRPITTGVTAEVDTCRRETQARRLEGRVWTTIAIFGNVKLRVRIPRLLKMSRPELGQR
jgi:hypothetical protein